MPGIEKIINPDAPYVEFATRLRGLRARANSPTYEVMAEKSGFAVPTLSQAANGRALPSRQVTLAYVRACEGDVETWERIWEEARLGVLPGQLPEPPVPPTPGTVATPAEFVACMCRLRKWANLSLRKLEGLSAREGEALRRATISNVEHRQSLPGYDFTRSYVVTCLVWGDRQPRLKTRTDVDAWLRVWNRLDAEQDRQKAAARSASTTEPVTQAPEPPAAPSVAPQQGKRRRWWRGLAAAARA